MSLSDIPAVRDLVVKSVRYSQLKQELEKIEQEVQQELISLNAGQPVEKMKELLKTEFIVADKFAIRFEEDKKTKSGFKVAMRITMKTEVIGE